MRPLIPFFLIMVMAGCAEAHARGIPPLIPEPRSVAAGEGSFRLAPEVAVLAKGWGEAARLASLLLREITESTGIVLKGEDIETRQLRRPSIILTSLDSPLAEEIPVREEVKKNEEGYILQVSRSGIILAAKELRGLFYGAMTLRQLVVKQGRGYAVPCLTIQDWPVFPLRGISDDISRGQVSTVENFKKIIRFLGRHKMNVYMPYIEDVFTFRSHPSIGKGRGALTPEEVKELQEYARDWFVEIIPIFQTLGHYENILIQPEFMDLAEFPGAASLNISNEKTYLFLRSLLVEIAPCFSSAAFHMGADETWDVGLGASRERIAKIGLDEALVRHYKRVSEMLKSLNKRVLMYGDIILENPGALSKLPKDIAVVNWQYAPAKKYPSIALLNEGGVKFHVSPALWNWRRAYPAYHTAFANILTLNREGFLGGASGTILSSWGDDGAENLRELNWPGYFLGAATAWSPMETSLDTLTAAFVVHHFGTEDERMTAVLNSLADVAPYADYHDIWRHPFLPPREGPPADYAQRIAQIRKKMGFVTKTLPSLKKSVRRNEDFLTYLDFTARQLLWFAEKVEYAREIGAACRAGKPGRPAVRKMLARCREMVRRLEVMKEEYRRLWLLTNRPENLDLLMRRYDMQISYWNEKLEELSAGLFRTDYALCSLWIYPEGALPRAGKGMVPVATFRKIFNLERLPSKAFLQLISDGHAVAALNGTYLGDVYARRTLSLTVEFQRVKWWDVAGLLRPGRNEIVVRLHSYERDGSGGLNAHMGLCGDSGVWTEIISDGTWESSVDGEIWAGSEVATLPIVITAPCFKAGRCSWIEK
jgi:hypothetical protein